MVRTSNSRSKPQRNPKSEKRFLARRRGILRAAAAAFREHGFQAAGMREIAEKAGLSPGNLYYYFPSKDHLLYFCQDHSLDRMLASAEEACASDAPAADKLRRVIGAHLRCMLDELDGAAAHVAVDALPPELREPIVAKRDRYEQALRGLVAEGVAAGEFAGRDPALVVRAMLGALNWTAHWYRPGGATSSEAVAREYADYLVRGLCP